MKRAWILCGVLITLAGYLSGCGPGTPYTIVESKTESSGRHLVVEVPQNTTESQLRTWGSEIASSHSGGSGTVQVTFFQSGDKGAPPIAIYSDGMLMMIKR